MADAPGREVQDDTNERKLRPGEVVSLPESLLPSGNRKTKPATWIRADREGEAKQNTQNATLYVLNNHRFPKWLYSYDSSVTRTQREMTHHLVVYVCQVTGTRSQHGEIDAVVLARQESPGFSLVSYRRSGNNASDAGCDLPAIEGASGSTFDAVDDDMSDMISSTMNDMEIDLGSSELYETKPPHSTHQLQYQVFSTQPKQEEMRQRVFSGGFLGSYRHQHEAAANPIRQVLPGPSSQDRYLWQVGSSARTCGFLDKGQHLLILWRFIQRLSLRDLGFDADAVHKEARTFWLRAAAALRESTPGSSQEFEGVVRLFLRDMFKSGASVPPARPAADSAKAPLSRKCSVVRVVIHLFLRALSSSTIQRLLFAACMVQSNAASKPQLQERFVILVSDLYDVLGDLLGEVTADVVAGLQGNQSVSLPGLVDEVLSVVYSLPCFTALRVEMSALLLSRETVSSLSEALNCSFQTFVALVREAMIMPINMQPAKKYGQQQPFATSPGYDDLEWNQRWLLEPGSLQMAHVAPGAARDSPSIADFAQIIYELGCIDIIIADDMSSLTVQSAYSFSGGENATPMTLVLDGRLRVFRVLPSGISSMARTAGGWSLGDYTATFSEDAHLFNVDFFVFADAKTNRQTDRQASHGVVQMRRVSLSMKLEENVGVGAGSADPGDLFAFVHGTVYGSIYKMQRLNLSESSTVDRAAVWREAEWLALWKLQAGYIALPRVGFV
ncbi:uncharacterized protein IUM83_19555 [Phytophthora cinnamomi]|uniref:uncharacterized protein n=1 Tax=Phytophthora cinnamomi TaxID=4785 RepID=UPI00355A3FCD|nr:hypothetical protein IUM83_19555 [Phytophthora cinnamomi]